MAHDEHTLRPPAMGHNALAGRRSPQVHLSRLMQSQMRLSLAPVRVYAARTWTLSSRGNLALSAGVTDTSLRPSLHGLSIADSSIKMI